MNRVYKVIWSHVRHCYVVVSELAHKSGKQSSIKSLGRMALAASLIMSLAAGPSFAAGLATGEGAKAAEGSIAAGKDAEAGYDSLAMGEGAYAYSNSIAIGEGAEARNSGFAFGRGASVSRSIPSFV